MNRLVLAFALVCCSAMVARADSVTISPSDQTLPVSTTATITGTLSLPDCPRVCNETLSLDILSGPDASLSVTPQPMTVTETDPNGDFDFMYTNDGVAGTDVVEVIASQASDPIYSNTVDITWVGAAATPEPSSFFMLLIGVAAIYFLSRRRMAAAANA